MGGGEVVKQKQKRRGGTEMNGKQDKQTTITIKNNTTKMPTLRRMKNKREIVEYESHKTKKRM